jgi:hypothetical protein
MTTIAVQPSGGGGDGSQLPKVVAELDGFPEGSEKVETYGGGGGTPIEINGGPLEGWIVGGGERDKVYGNT